MDQLIVTEKGLKISHEAPRAACWLFHRWGKWVVVGHGDVESDGAVVGRFIEQRRDCLRCGKIQLREAQT
jgi:hypothetical protein